MIKIHFQIESSGTLQHVSVFKSLNLLQNSFLITRMLISIVSRPFMNDINSIIDHMFFTNQLGDTKVQSKYCEFKWY